jgi:hypothetical protein
MKRHESGTMNSCKEVERKIIIYYELVHYFHDHWLSVRYEYAFTGKAASMHFTLNENQNDYINNVRN